MKTVNYNSKGQTVVSRKSSKGTGFTLAKAQLILLGFAVVAVSMVMANIF